MTTVEGIAGGITTKIIMTDAYLEHVARLVSEHELAGWALRSLAPTTSQYGNTQIYLTFVRTD